MRKSYHYLRVRYYSIEFCTTKDFVEMMTYSNVGQGTINHIFCTNKQDRKLYFSCSEVMRWSRGLWPSKFRGTLNYKWNLVTNNLVFTKI